MHTSLILEGVEIGKNGRENSTLYKGDLVECLKFVV